MATAVSFSLAQDTRTASASSVRVRTVLGIATAIVVVVALIDAMSSPAIGVLIALAAVTPWVIAMPVRGLQILVGAATAIEVFPLGFPDSLTDRVPFFLNLNNSLGVSGISATPAELLMGLALVLAFMRSDATVRARLYRGRLFWAYVIFIAAVLMGELHGLMNGGDFNKSLWELRPQAYGFVGFVTASLLIRSHKDIEAIVVAVVAAVLVKSVIGDVRYFFVLNHNLGTHETVLGHEDSFFLVVALLGSLATFIWQGWTRTLKYLIPLTLLGGLALLVNERRAGMAALGGGVIFVVLLAIRYHPTHRRRIAWLALLGTAAAIIFLMIFWNDQTGVIGQLVRPVRSQFDPSYRDYLSNLYRQAENINLQLSFQTNKVIGMGFGMPFLIVVTQADISSVYPLWNYIPHNTLFWVGVRMGLVGSVAFWAFMGCALLEVCRALRVQRDRFVLTMVSIAGGAIIAELLVAYADVQLESYRNMIVVGVILGIVNIVPALFPEPAEEPRRFV